MIYVYLKKLYFLEIMNRNISVEDFFKNSIIFYQKMPNYDRVEIELDLDKEGDMDNLASFFKRVQIEF